MRFVFSLTVAKYAGPYDRHPKDGHEPPQATGRVCLHISIGLGLGLGLGLRVSVKVRVRVRVRVCVARHPSRLSVDTDTDCHNGNHVV